MTPDVWCDEYTTLVMPDPADFKYWRTQAYLMDLRLIYGTDEDEA